MLLVFVVILTAQARLSHWVQCYWCLWWWQLHKQDSHKVQSYWCFVWWWQLHKQDCLTECSITGVCVCVDSGCTSRTVSLSAVLLVFVVMATAQARLSHWVQCYWCLHGNGDCMMEAFSLQAQAAGGRQAEADVRLQLHGDPQTPQHRHGLLHRRAHLTPGGGERHFASHGRLHHAGQNHRGAGPTNQRSHCTEKQMIQEGGSVKWRMFFSWRRTAVMMKNCSDEEKLQWW